MSGEAERLRWSFSKAGRRGWNRRAWFRATVDRHLFRYETEHCQRCGRRVGQVWHCKDDATWAAATGKRGGGGLRCIRCFDHEAGVAGVPVYWLAVHPDEYEPLGYPPLASPVSRETVVAGGVEANKETP